MADDTYECIVIGVGGVGSAACYHLARRGIKVLGLDQFVPGHDRGSSHGDTRAIRLAYFEHPDYVPLLKRAFELWQELDHQSQPDLFHQTGILQVGPADGSVIPGLFRAAEEHQLDMEEFDRAELERRFPGFHAGEDDVILLDPHGGVLRVEDCIKSHVSLAKTSGASFIFGEQVKAWKESSGYVTVETNQNRYRCARLVLTPGAWAKVHCREIAGDLHLLRKSLFWFEDGKKHYALDKHSPVFLYERGEHTFYGFPSLGERGVKIGDHSGGKRIRSPKRLKRTIMKRELRETTEFLRDHLPELGTRLTHHTACMYTMSPDGHFIVGKYPGTSRVSVTAGLSGHGFKFAAVLGEIMADLVVDGSTPHPIGFLDPARLSTIALSANESAS